MIPDHQQDTASDGSESRTRWPAAMVPGSPGEVLLRLFMTPLGLTAYRVSSDLSVPPIAISEILRGKRAISAVMATRLASYFGVEPHFWLALQSAYDLSMVLRRADGNSQSTGVMRCRELLNRRFVIRESRNGGDRNYDVILAKMRLATTTQTSMPRSPAKSADKGEEQQSPAKPDALNNMKRSKRHQL